MASVPESESDSLSHAPNVEILETPRIPVIPFAVSLPASTFQDPDDPMPIKASTVSIVGDNAIVGSIVLLKNSVMVWVGWGSVDLYGSAPVATNENGPASSSFGKGAPVMGQVVVSMPRTNYKGAFGTGSKEPSCSHIIGSASSEDQMLASQMASRLTTRSGMAVFVSCQLSSPAGGGNTGGWTAGMDSDVISHRAAALAEKEVWKLLQEHQKKRET